MYNLVKVFDLHVYTHTHVYWLILSWRDLCVIQKICVKKTVHLSLGFCSEDFSNQSNDRVVTPHGCMPAKIPDKGRGW